MISFGYNNKISSILRSIATFIIGTAMIVKNNHVETLMHIMGVALIIVGACSLLFSLLSKSSGKLHGINSFVDIIFGVILLLGTEFIAGSLVMIIGIILLVLGIIQFLALIGTVALLGSSVPLIIMSALSFLGGVLLIFNPFSFKIMSIIAGIFLVIYSITDLISLFRVHMTKKKREKKNKRDDDDENHGESSRYIITDVKYEKIEDK